MNNKIDFIVAAINDTQTTIRAIDVKVGALLAGVLFPLSSLGKVWAHLNHLVFLFSSFHAIIAGFVFFTMWLFAILSLVRTISAIDNPSNHIINSNDFNGSFYGGGLYNFGIIDVLFNRTTIKANKDVFSFSDKYPDNEDSIISELSFEHMKLIYIRDIKLFRLNFALKITFIWILFGIIIYIFSKLG